MKRDGSERGKKKKKSYRESRITTKHKIDLDKTFRWLHWNENRLNASVKSQRCQTRFKISS